MMARVKGRDTRPEVMVRQAAHALGLRFRLHRKNLPGRPDLTLPRHRTVVMVHGCFWHRHAGCRRATTPATRTDYWLPKFERNVARDLRNAEELERLGWRVVVIWECETKDRERLTEIIRERVLLA